MNNIRLRKNSLWIENISALRLAKKYKTPFYCYSFKQLKENYNFFKHTFKKINPLICFSVKSNSNVNLLRELKKMGSGADVVSIGELLKSIKYPGFTRDIVSFGLIKKITISNKTKKE